MGACESLSAVSSMAGCNCWQPHMSCSESAEYAGDQIIVLAEDDDTYKPHPAPKGVDGGSCPEWRSKRQPEKVLFCGCVFCSRVSDWHHARHVWPLTTKPLWSMPTACISLGHQQVFAHVLMPLALSEPASLYTRIACLSAAWHCALPPAAPRSLQLASHAAG